MLLRGLRLLHGGLGLRQAVFEVDDFLFGDGVVLKKIAGAVKVRLRFRQACLGLPQGGAGLQVGGLDRVHIRAFQREDRLTFFHCVAELDQHAGDSAWGGQHDARYRARVGLDLAWRDHLVSRYFRRPDGLYAELPQLGRVRGHDYQARRLLRQVGGRGCRGYALGFLMAAGGQGYQEHTGKNACTTRS